MVRILFILLICSSAFGQAFTLRDPAFTVVSVPVSGVSYIFTEGFEEVNTGGGLGSATDGFDSTNIFQNAGAANPDYTAVVIDGAQSLQTTNTQPVRFVLDTTYNELWVMFHFISLSNFSTALAAFTTSGNVVQGQVTFQGTGTGVMRAYNGGSTFTATVSSMTTNTAYYVWYHWKSDGTADGAFSTTTTRPTSGNAFASVSAGTGTSGCIRLLIGPGSAGPSIIYDTIKVSATGYPTP